MKFCSRINHIIFNIIFKNEKLENQESTYVFSFMMDEVFVQN